jgi:hypothetical protein
MTFARRVFTIAGIYGLLVVTPLYFLEDRIGRDQPPAITHPEFFYGFIGVTLAWQVAFLVIARDPVRYRLLMIPAIIEKVTYVIALLVLFLNGRIPGVTLVPGAGDLVLGSLFVMSWLKTRPA